MTEDGSHPPGQLGAVAARKSVVILVGRATRVPRQRDTHGNQRTTTVTVAPPVTWLSCSPPA